MSALASPESAGYAEDVLFERWQQTLADRRDSPAVTDAVTGRTRTFGDLQRALDEQPALARGALHAACVAEGIVAFLVQTLRAWRDGAVLCPMEREAVQPPRVGPLPAGIAHLKQTSGSTGEPRCVAFRAAQLMADAANIQSTMGLEATSPNVAVVSVAHSYGFSSLVLPLLLQGHPILEVPDALPASLRAAFARGSALTLPAVPAMWRAWHLGGLLKGAPISLAISAGAPLTLELEEGVFAASGLKLHNFYGSSECGGIAYDRTAVPRTDAALAGTPMHGVSLSVNDDGRLVVRGANVGVGYLDGDAETLDSERFVTSDLVEITEGRVLMRGRVSDAINIAGRKLNPAEVEAALLAYPGVTHAVVFGVPSGDAARCEDVVACVNLPGAESTPALLTEWLGERLPLWQVPRRIWFCDELRADCRGKTPRRVWRERWLAVASR